MPEIPRSERKTQNRVIALLTELDAAMAVREQRRQKTCALKQVMRKELLTGRSQLA